MSIANPLTAGIETQRVAVASPTQVKATETPETSFGVFAEDVLEISSLGREKLQKENQLDAANRQIEQIAKEFIRVSSSLGKSEVANNLNHEQATTLYKAIAALL
ncbi:hypothetical protein [Thalassomonas actiniarum]|uniref:Uncharacterized protein n=1 Tax=Thalassomonas actiniarum TaxID=485447 RepID=A0AAE9YQE2_9GAMM|nr:hypothetical protein [Thalassomonas actiniarum]WDD99364.1 hypothetical protein SG35_001350 [Thalassomonas actiniarum]